MSNVSYKKIAVSILASLDNGTNKAIGIVSSNPKVDVNAVAKNIADAFEQMDSTVICADAVTSDRDDVTFCELKKQSEHMSLTALKPQDNARLTGYIAKEQVDSWKAAAQITIVALDNPADSISALMLGGCCDGILLAEQVNSSRSDKIEATLSAVSSIFVEPIGFVLV